MLYKSDIFNKKYDKLNLVILFFFSKKVFIFIIKKKKVKKFL